MLVVVGGQARKVGKTAVVAGLIRALPEARWTAIKISPHAHGAAGHTLQEESAPGEDTDSGRYLVAGATHAYWLRAGDAELELALPSLQSLIEGNVILESNRVLDYVRPDLLLMVVDSETADCKASSRKHMASVDAFVTANERPAWADTTKPCFPVRAPDYSNPDLVELVRSRLRG